ncbi:MAG: hypothetical protein H0V17_21320 [Deltaproteobacteria bacterium]|nr:hypothetical protein [Deltaproteobacteria bacterium]
MVQTQPDIASSSVPDLRASKPAVKIILALGALAIVGAVVAAVMILRGTDNPGAVACDHIEQLAEKDPARWDRYVKALERTVEKRVWNSVDRQYVNIQGDTRRDRCEVSFRIIRETISYGAYTKLSACVTKVTSFKQGSDCFDDF